ncbi:uncharacterized protein L969DRAFT_95739 [Mixia osmundae IAM 14324]|uniref:AP complex subunit beta n=1 Tax=Mixia osmundae (strain CBS 9802 / IAM 14324 / JCM 22182 / KY 12970) TaxID=764103 RepID=G7E0Q0_MIXOS|nr:uncharacterized protein L969DRAFT_95739 [Mixia osmundae IAM 14324]KEI37886.1 hypothetical protein L969DRAFT_95739 [Mixia osmundae IAM 14324]GAA96410.1 hypothetical protein E5Q_03077 [Mixia osmundae IAM 14324]
MLSSLLAHTVGECETPFAPVSWHGARARVSLWLRALSSEVEAMSQDAKFFTRDKAATIRAELQSDKKDKSFVKRRNALKKVIGNMTMGQDMSSLFPDVVACMSIPVLDVKKMVYLYLINYSRSKPDMVQFALENLLNDAEDRNPLVRALAIRTMAYIPVPSVINALVDPLRQSIKDSDPYVRKTAAICVAKLFAHDSRLVEREGFITSLRDLLADANPTVVANAVAALTEIGERSDNIQLRLNFTIAGKLVSAMAECSEWGQTYILEALMSFVPNESADAELIAERIAIRLQHANSAVVLTTIKVILYLLNYIADEDIVENMCRKLSPPLVTLLSSGYEVQYVALRNILLIIQRRPSVLRNEVKVFFCKYNDPIYVKLAKLEIMYRLASQANVRQVLAELKEYSTEVDVDFVRKAVRSIGRLAIKIEESADQCIETLLELVETKVSYVVQEAVIVIKDIFRRYPNQYEGIIATLCDNLDVLDTPEAKASIIWIVGQYADRIENATALLEDFAATFIEETVEVQLALLTATVKLFIKRPTAGQDLLPKVLKWATEQVDNPDLRDRGFIYWRLLSTDPAAAKDIVLVDKPAISTETEAMDRHVLDRLLLQTGTLSSVYHQAPETFIRNQKPRYLHDSPALDPIARQHSQERQTLASMRAAKQPSSSVPGYALAAAAMKSTASNGTVAPPLPPKPTAAEVAEASTSRSAPGEMDDATSEDAAPERPSIDKAESTYSDLDPVPMTHDPYAGLGDFSAFDISSGDQGSAMDAYQNDIVGPGRAHGAAETSLLN